MLTIEKETSATLTIEREKPRTLMTKWERRPAKERSSTLMTERERSATLIAERGRFDGKREEEIVNVDDRKGANGCLDDREGKPGESNDLVEETSDLVDPGRED